MSRVRVLPKSLPWTPHVRPRGPRTVLYVQGRPEVRPVEAVLAQRGLRRVPEPVPAARVVDVDLSRETRLLVQEARVLRLDELLAEPVPVVGRERVEADVLLEDLGLDRVVGRLRLLAAEEAEELEVALLALVGQPRVNARLLDRGVLPEPVRRLVRPPHVGLQPRVAEPSRLEAGGRPLRAEGAEGEARRRPGRLRQVEAREVDRAREAGDSRGRGPDAPLHLEVLDGASEVREVDEVERSVLGFVQRHAVEREVDPGRADAAHRDVRVAVPEAGVGVVGHRGKVREEGGHLLADVLLRDLLPGDVRLRHGGVGVGADGLDDDLLGAAE